MDRLAEARLVAINDRKFWAALKRQSREHRSLGGAAFRQSLSDVRYSRSSEAGLPCIARSCLTRARIVQNAKRLVVCVRSDVLVDLGYHS